MTDSVVQQFAALLAHEEDPVKREAMLARVKMLALNAADPEVFEPPIRTLGEYLDTPIEVPPSLVWPTILVRGEITTTLGRAGYGKTTMNLNRLLKWGAGMPLFDTFTSNDEENPTYLMPCEPLKILIIENEGSAGMFHQKVGIMLKNGEEFNGDQMDLVRENVMIWGDGGYSGLKLDDPAMLNNVRAGVEKHEPDVVFVEPFRSLWKGEENSSTDMAIVVDNLIALGTDYGCAVILSHHERKSGAGEDGELMSAGRGSTVLEGAVALMENFQKAKGGDFRELTWSKARYLQPPPPTRLQYDPTTLWYRHVPIDEIEQSIMRCLEEASGEPLTVKEIAGELDETESKTRKLLTALAKEDRVKKMKSESNGMGTTGTRYRLPSGDNENGGLEL